MRIEVRLFAHLTAYLPRGSDADRAVLDVPERSTVAEVMRALGIPEDMPRITLVNGVDAEADRTLAAGDTLTVFPPLAGGEG